MDDGRKDALRRGAVEGGAALVAVAVAIAVVARIASTARAALLFTDGDSMLPVLVMRSLAVGQPQDWAMSSVLFLPELLVFGGIWLLRLGADATIAVNAVVNLVALYGALRVAAGPRARSRAPVAGALLAFAAFATLAALDHSASRDSLELASLLATTTYYSATVVGVIVSVGLVRRAVGPARHRRASIAGLAVVAGVCALSNPLYLLWAAVPLTALLLVVRLRRRDPGLLPAAGALVVGSAAGYAGRVPLAPFIANDGLGYIEPGRIGDSARSYGQLVADLCGSPGGAASLGLTLALLAVAVWSTVRLRGRPDAGALLVATAGWLLPVFVVAAAILLGTHAARYLQPAVFAPVMALAVLPDAVRLRRPRPAWRPMLAAAAAAVAVVAVVAGVPRLASAAGRQDPDLDCVTTWVDRSGRVGAGQYWTIRLPKAHVADPRTLVQVDATLRPYDWLVNRADADVGAVSFLVIDDQSPPFALPSGATSDDASTIRCGRYTIEDFGSVTLPLGAPRS